MMTTRAWKKVLKDPFLRKLSSTSGGLCPWNLSLHPQSLSLLLPITSSTAGSTIIGNSAAAW